MNRSVLEVSSQQSAVMLVCSTSRLNNHIRFARDKLQLYDALRSQDYKYSKQITSNIRRPFLTNGFKFHFPFFAKNKRKRSMCSKNWPVCPHDEHFSSESSKNQKQSNHNSQSGERKIPVKPMRAQSKNNLTAKARENLRGKTCAGDQVVIGFSFASD